MDQIKQRLLEMQEIPTLDVIKYNNAQDLLDFAWEKLHAGRWDQVEDVWRDLYALAAIPVADIQPQLRDKIKILDTALIMCREGEYKDLLMEKIGEIEEQIIGNEKKRKRLELDQRVDSVDLKNDKVQRIHALKLSILGFAERMKMNQPFIIQGLLEDWPAFVGDRSWRDVDNVVKMAGHRYVPVEIGQHYASEQWGQKMMFLVYQFLLE
jgi:hypothetical protein